MEIVFKKRHRKDKEDIRKKIEMIETVNTNFLRFKCAFGVQKMSRAFLWVNPSSFSVAISENYLGFLF